jgi:hypothetical protein
MPRRNRNARTIPGLHDLADQIQELAAYLTGAEPCAGCRVNPATDGAYCALCKGHIILDARRISVKRR